MIIKVFTDASYIAELKLAIISSKIVCNEQEFIYSGTKFNVQDSIEAEILAIKKSVVVIRKRTKLPITIFTDCKPFVGIYKELITRDFKTKYKCLAEHLIQHEQVYLVHHGRDSEEIKQRHKHVTKIKKTILRTNLYAGGRTYFSFESSNSAWSNLKFPVS